METINSIANAATKVIWGENGKDGAVAQESNEEPISGVQGDTAKGEPFDAGNMSDPVVKKSDNANVSGAQESSAPPGDNTKAQIDTREPADEQTLPSVALKKSDVDNTEPLDPKSLKGPGPKPLEQVAKEHGGDAGNTTRESQSNGGTDDPTMPPPPDSAASGNKPDDEPARKPDGEGTGEKLVKSSGLEVDGGDFDAANPGAGREADRLLEQKGIHHKTTTPGKKASSPDDKTASPNGESSSPERKGVRGLGHKIKAKLRRSSNA